MQISDFSVYFFVDSRKKKFRVGSLQQGRSGNRKDTYFFGFKIN